MSAGSHDLGRKGEQRALLYYRLRGYRLLARNFKAAGGEIDLVVQRWNSVVFVEVKTRGEHSRGEPWEAVDEQKQHRIVAAAERFLVLRHMEERSVRFDVIAIAPRGGRARLTRYRDAFRPERNPDRPWLWK